MCSYETRKARDHLNMASTHIDLSSSPSTSSQQHLLWSIDMAERYLICGLFEEATISASLVLEKLCKEMLQNEAQEADELDDLIESAGMLLIQAHNENHCAEKIFKDLEVYFGCIVEVPPSLLLAGICLQISSGQFLVAQLVLDELFKSWKSSTTSNGCSGMVGIAKKKRNSAFPFRQIAELYTVEILTKGLRLEKKALEWLGQANISEGDKKDIEQIIKKYAHSSQNVSKVSEIIQDQPHTDIPSLRNRTFALEELVNDESERKNFVETDLKFTSTRASVVTKVLHLFSPVLMLYSKVVASSPGNFSRTGYKYARFLSKKEVVGSIATFVIAYGLYRQRQCWKRRVRLSIQAVYAGLVDFWQLAFNVQLNPLAAVQPLPPVHHTR